ncbi:MAG: arginine--tRNA ligase [Bacillota bacterium]
MIETTIETAIKDALKQLNVDDRPIKIEVPNDKSNGDFSTNVAMTLAKELRKNPMLIAEDIVNLIGDIDGIKTIEAARPGFINFTVDKTLYHSVIKTINDLRGTYGDSDIGKGEHFNIEFVSANPTGTLHIGHARGAAAGDTLTRILKKAGYKVTKEFYVNDGGNQIHNLAISIKARYKQAFGIDADLPEDGYYGNEIKLIAETIKQKEGDRFLHEDGYEFFKTYGVDALLSELKEDLKAFNVEFDVWFHETTLYKERLIEKTLKTLENKGYTYKADGALWLKTSDFEDEKDRVIIKSDGTNTYLLPDIAYHNHKLSRGYTKLIDILGGDHHGYLPRLKSAIHMIGGKSDLLEVDLLQMVKVVQDGEEVKMSKRSGKTITIKSLVEEVGKDPIRYFFAMRSLNTQMELDLDLALKQTNENPVYYAQYAHARIASVLRQAQQKHIDLDLDLASFDTFNSDKIDDLLTLLREYPNVIEAAASKRLMHKVPQYIHKLASSLHTFYASEKVITDDLKATQERLALMHAVKVVLKDALTLVGVEAKESM